MSEIIGGVFGAVAICFLLFCSYMIGWLDCHLSVNRRVFRAWLDRVLPGDPLFWEKFAEYDAAREDFDAIKDPADRIASAVQRKLSPASLPEGIANQ